MKDEQNFTRAENEKQSNILANPGKKSL